ncbi:MAG: endolytic transglycosylase MltG [Cyclobacteriaceae bacterium]|nr:endolytic transglycosylase MltG [Cyclobacteriaceae bacterium]MCX7636635.1 endolytic transglycosylase MltG [Cyclobacteriaceae bacterium]MDW8331869.1 endolytic transglycosylase MltG [Cyclobacteriaceae bacterium]
MKGFRRLALFLLFSVLLITFVFYFYQICYTPNILVGKEPRELIIPDSATFKTVQQILHEGGYVQDLISFSFLARLMGYDKQIKPGRYVLRANMNNLEAIRYLRLGRQEPVMITFNNVRLIPELAKKITRNIAMTPAAFEAALIQFAMTNSYGFNKDNVLAMFIPNTYEVYYDVSPEGLIERMYEEYRKFWNEERMDKAKALGLTPVEVSILASIVQAETVKREEAPVIAGLYINRLKKDMLLQADPTLVYAWGDFSLKRVLNQHKEIDSPYNTYKYKGLPPGPINMPEIYFIDAVLNHKPSNYLYMCAREDFSGYHNFAATLTEHNRNAARYQQALTREQRKARLLNKKM